eukprot:c24923_g1_i1 orf=223-3093(-)
MELVPTSYEQLIRWRSESGSHGFLYGSSQRFLLRSLEFTSPVVEDVAAGAFGSIFLGTLRYSYEARIRLCRGIWAENEYQDPDSCLLDEETIVAVKKIKASEDEVLEVMREASNLRVLRGARNVVNVYGAIRSQQLQSVCIVMDLVECDKIHCDKTHEEDDARACLAPHLNKFLRSFHPPAPTASWWKTKLEIFMELVMGISLCHKRGVFHGDLKGENVLLDEFLVPKVVDFGMSFCRRDLSYLKSLGGSLFWISPELLESPLPEVFRNPYPSDTFSLGMILVEMFLDGDILASVSDQGFYCDRLQGIAPVDLTTPAGMHEFEPVFCRLVDLVDKCCMSDREDRISLECCLAELQAAYLELCSIGTRLDSNFLGDATMTSSEEYRHMLKAFQERFPNVPDSVVLQPAKNMMVNIEGDLLVHLFCKLNFLQGVEFIIDKGNWNFEPARQVPYMCTICVQEGSLDVLKFLGSRWKDIVLQEEWLVHEACDAESVDVLRFLLSDIGLDYDTWCDHEYLKPLHKLAYQGKVEMMQIILDCAKSIPDYFNTIVHSRTPAPPLFYAIEGDKVEAVLFLLNKGAALPGDFKRKRLKRKYRLIQTLLFALECGSLSIVTGLLDSVISKPWLKFYLNFLGLFDGDEHICEVGLQLLKNHLVDSKGRGLEPFCFGCFKGNEAVFRVIISFFKDRNRSSTRFYNPFLVKLCHNLGAYGSKEMAGYALEKVINMPRYTLEEVEKRFVSEIRDSASKHGNTEVAEYLREWKVEQEKTQKNMSTRYGREDGGAEEELRQAVRIGNIVLVTDKISLVLADLGDKSSSFLCNLGDICCREGHLEIFKLLEQHGLDSLNSDAAYVSAQYGQLSVLDYLLEKGVGVNNMSESAGWTPLLGAVYGQHYDVVNKLLEVGADPNVRSDAGFTAMDLALGCNNRKFIRLLINHGFDTGMKSIRTNSMYMDLISDLPTS